NLLVDRGAIVGGHGAGERDEQRNAADSAILQVFHGGASCWRTNQERREATSRRLPETAGIRDDYEARAPQFGHSSSRTDCYALRVSPPTRLTKTVEDRFWLGVEAAQKFFMGEAEVQLALQKLVRTLDAQGIPYAIIGA